MSLSSSDTDINKGLDLPDDCLSHIHKRLKSGTDHSSFGLVCHRWLDIQRNNHVSLWDIDDSECSLRRSSNISPESFSIILSKLLTRFQPLKSFSLCGLPDITDYVTSQSQLFGSKFRFLCLRYWSKYTDKKMSLIFSSFPHLASVGMKGSNITNKGLEIMEKCCAILETIDLSSCQMITDKGLEVLAKSCASLNKIDLGSCQQITDSGIRFLIQNCLELHSIRISYYGSVTGIGFLGCQKTLSNVYAVDVPKLTTEGIKAISGGSRLQRLCLSGNPVNTEAVFNNFKRLSSIKGTAANIFSRDTAKDGKLLACIAET
ncbi:F-box/LRR-repeat protein 12-like [Papaver somniferum]|uniref:F-box/LRR-repeat protein 12-like n=1 Tax=Papaver somniferum TaxID=3469 RepID=UPI000E7042CC|nr:F-box/LRR-repeat protein 12-like [Papaver somniferum]